MARAKTSTETPRKRVRPALTPEGREQQLMALAYDLVEQRLLDGTATSQETTHFLKLASKKAQLENTILENQAKLIVAKTKAIEDSADMKVLYAEAIEAMKMYNGYGGQDE